jgi:hypothetical protein
MTLIVAILIGSVLSAMRPLDARDEVATIVQRITRADYEGNRAELKRLHGELAPYAAHPAVGARVAYWRGFAMWRRALNGFNESADRAELDQDLTQCVVDFRAAIARDPAFADANGGAASCLVNHSFLVLRSDPARARELFEQSAALLTDALTRAPDNPRLLWVKGANEFYSPAERGGGPTVALATYQRALRLAREQRRPADPLEPAWGEPELLMNLAFANLKRATPDALTAAEGYAAQALALVPHWHYVRDILLPQIRTAKRSKAGVSTEDSCSSERDAGNERGFRSLSAYVTRSAM